MLRLSLFALCEALQQRHCVSCPVLGGPAYIGYDVSSMTKSAAFGSMCTLQCFASHGFVLRCVGRMALHCVALTAVCVFVHPQCIASAPTAPPPHRVNVSCCRPLLANLLTSLLGCEGRATWLLLLTSEAAPRDAEAPSGDFKLHCNACTHTCTRLHTCTRFMMPTNWSCTMPSLVSVGCQ